MDIQGLLRGRIEDTLRQAREAENAGQWEKAAASYQYAALLQRQYASRLTSLPARQAALKRADDWESYAKRLFGGWRPSPLPPHDTPQGEEIARKGEGTSELRSLVESLILKGSTTRWEDIAGLDEVKQELKMAFALNFVQMPEGVKREYWDRILLYGPPGTGKTMLAAAVAGSIPGATFFNAQWSGLASKWFGETERIIQTLYETARERSPSVVFLDEVDAVASSREEGSTSEASKRALSALLVAVGGLSDKVNKDKLEPPFVLTFAATNRPWDLDAAFVSRFAKAVYIPLPDHEARKKIFFLKLEKRGYKVNASYDTLARLTEGYSGRDLETLCRQAIVHMIYEQNPRLTELVDKGIEELKKYQLHLRPITQEDIERALKQVRPTVTPEYVMQYNQWRKMMGF